MSLIPQEDTPGLWVNPDWQRGTPGTFALIIGVSSYDHLAGGSAPVSTTYGLGQLYVSAFTAFRFWQWLRDHYRYDPVPLAQCWLLTAPTEAELAAEPALAVHALRPTYEACERAIGGWFSAMKQLAKPSQQHSRSFFFWSGHGLEVHRDKQLLLPCDYLKPPLENVNRALSTFNLYAGAASLDVPEQFLFADACRNDNQQLRDLDLQGFAILNESPAYRSNKNLIAPILFASASGSQAWQPNEPSKGPSIFGQALLEGLRATNGIELDCNTTPCTVKVFNLQSFLTRRVSELLRAYRMTVPIPVGMGGAPNDAVVTQVVGQAIEQQTRGRRGPAGPQPPSFETWQPVTELQAQGARSVDNVPDFGTPALSALWQTLTMYDLERHQALEPRSDLTLHRVERADEHTYRVTLSLTEPRSSWLQLTNGETSFAVVLGGDGSGDVRYSLELRLSDGGQLIQLTGTLDPAAEGPLSEAARLWDTYAHRGLGAALALLRERSPHQNSNTQSPLSNLVAALLLLRARDPDLLPTGFARLAAGFPGWPDSAVLWAEYLLHRQGNAGERPAAEALGILLGRGLPLIGEIMGLAARQTADLLRGDQLSADERVTVTALDRQLRTALRFFVSGGLFATFVGPTDEITPTLVRPSPTRLSDDAVAQYTVSPRRFAMDVSTLVPSLIAFLSPMLPYLTKAGKQAAEEASKQFGGAAWDYGKRIWQKLLPPLRANPAAAHAVNNVLTASNDEQAHATLQDQLRQLLQANPQLVQELQRLLGEAQQVGDTIYASGSYGFLNRPSGPVEQQFGDRTINNSDGGDIIGNQTIGGDYVRGNKTSRTIDVGTGTYVEGNDQRSGAFVSGGTVYGPVVGSSSGTINTSYSHPGASARPVTALEQAQGALERAIHDAGRANNVHLQEDLQQVSVLLQQAARAEASNDAARRSAKLAAAQEQLRPLVNGQPPLQAVLEQLAQA